MRATGTVRRREFRHGGVEVAVADVQVEGHAVPEPALELCGSCLALAVSVIIIVTVSDGSRNSSST